MNEFSLKAHSPDENRHECTSYIDGDWVVFICDRCPMYERRIHRQSGAMRVRHGDDLSVTHFGMQAPSEAHFLQGPLLN